MTTLKASNIEELLGVAEKVQVAGTDVDGVLRGKVISRNKFLSTVKDGFGFCSVVFGWDIVDKAYSNTSFSTADTGYGDILAKADVQSLRRIPWQNDIPLFLLDFNMPDGSFCHVCPRSLLKKVLADYDSLGYKTYAAVELEFYCFKETPESLAEKAGSLSKLTPLTPGMFGYSMLRPCRNQEFYDQVFDYCKRFGVPLEGWHTETGPGVFEVAIEYAESLISADRAQLFKLAVKQIGMKYGILPSFMAKPNQNLPGCSGHTHYSVWDKEGKTNLFYDEKDPNKMSDLMKHFLAGQLHCLPYILPLFAPTVNSYKRLVENYWAPVVLSWGVENRTSACRVINLNPKATRIETRIGGADINAYLAIGGALAAGLYGIRHKLPLQPESKGDNIQDKNIPRLSANLYEAAMKMGEPKSVARELFGDQFVDHFVATRLHEWREYSLAITDWELKRYMELV